MIFLFKQVIFIVNDYHSLYITDIIDPWDLLSSSSYDQNCRNRSLQVELMVVINKHTVASVNLIVD